MKTNVINPTEQDERNYMKQVIAILEKTIEGLDKVINANVKDLKEYKAYLWENQSELDRAEKSAVRHNVTQAVLSSEAIMERKKRLRRQIEIPYFGRIDFKEANGEETLPIYIGLYSFYDAEKNQNVIHDWRAPISTMFYDYELGEASYEAPTGTVTGNISLKRQYRIRRSIMEFMIESSVNIGDDILQKELSSNSDDRMKNIVATIQREQNRIIRNDDAQTLIIQGVAGSGKTSIALHRVAYILYRHKGEISSKEILIISPNKVFADYISNVLPELGEEQIEECGFEELMSKKLNGKYKFQNFFEQVTELLEHPEDQAYIDRIRFKASYELLGLLDKFILHVENSLFEAEDIKVGRIPVPKEFLEEKFKSYHRIPMRNRFDPIARDIINELRLKCGMDLGTKEKNDLKANIKKMFKGNNDLDLYKQFYEWIGKPDYFQPKKGRKLEYADVAPLLYIKLMMEGDKDPLPIKHLLVDEMQDYTPIQYRVLNKLFNCKKTILGDAQQSVNPYSSTNYQEIQQVLGGEVMKLCKSYRSTYEITDFAQRISTNKELEAIERHGEKPALYCLKNEKEEHAKIGELIEKFLHSENCTMGIICKTQKQAQKLYEAIEHFSTHICMITEESAAFSSGIIITTAHLAKGLEFDEVIVPMTTSENYNNEMDRSMLFIACTRAMHKLSITASKEMSKFIPQE